MTSSTDNQQASITAWFDNVYTRRGNRYLRPTRAYYVFLELLGASRGQAMLDVACGLGRLLEAGRDYDLEMSGIDISAIAVAEAQRNVPEASVVVGNAESLPYTDELFDHVCCLGSLERMLDQDAALAEMRRVGRPNARYCILVRNADSMRWRTRTVAALLAGNAGNAGADSLSGWTQQFETAGFNILDVLPDQYPLHKRARRRSLYLRPVDYRRTHSASLDQTSKFVFLLEKAR